MVEPPKPTLSTSNLAPTESGPMDIRPDFLTRTIEPPPRAMLWTSGIVKFVRTPAILTNAADCLGYPVLRRAQMSVVVLETSVKLQDLASFSPGKHTLQHRQPKLPCHPPHPKSEIWPVKRRLLHYSSVRTKNIVPDTRLPS
jgi:hypothetical protein